MVKKVIYGIQQIGVGVPSVKKSFEWYATNFGADLCIFEDDSPAVDMAPFMGGKPHEKYAMLAMNIQGGGGYEFWEYLDREPTPPKNDIVLGDYGINAMMIKSRDVAKSYARLQKNEVDLLSEVHEDPIGRKMFHCLDLYGNMLIVKEFNSWYKSNDVDTGGTFGCMLGVSDIEKSRRLYSDILGYTDVVYDVEGTLDSLSAHDCAEGKYRRVLLTHPEKRRGGFSKLYGDSQLELIQSLDRKPNKIYEDRYWGDLGFIHLCFDVKRMNALVEECKEKGFPFDVLSNDDFDMGEAAGHFGYIQDPDGTLIEFVETHKVPIIKSLNININLRNRDPQKCLPNWLINGLRFRRRKVG